MEEKKDNIQIMVADERHVPPLFAQLRGGVVDGQTHVGAGIAVRHGKDV